MVWRWGAVVTGARAPLTDAGTGGGAVVTGTRPRQTETPCPSARNGVALWSRPILVQLEAVLLAIRLIAHVALQSPQYRFS